MAGGGGARRNSLTFNELRTELKPSIPVWQMRHHQVDIHMGRTAANHVFKLDICAIQLCQSLLHSVPLFNPDALGLTRKNRTARINRVTIKGWPAMRVGLTPATLKGKRCESCEVVSIKFVVHDFRKWEAPERVELSKSLRRSTLTTIF
jgi:hypothetical protein